jgi:hypothetical protein
MSTCAACPWCGAHVPPKTRGADRRVLFRYMPTPLARDLPQADGCVARSLFYRATAALKINPEIKKGIASNAPNRNIPIALCSATYVLSQSR